MAMKKLTLAAAVSFGMLAMGTGIAGAESLSPSDPCIAPELSAAAPSSSEILIQKKMDEAGMVNAAYPCDIGPALPVVTGPACPVFQEPVAPACPCPTDVSPACPVDVSPACPVCPTPDPCEKPKTSCGCLDENVPASASCPNVDKKAGMFQRQIYSYPASIYGGNSAFSVASQDLYFGEQIGSSVANGKMPCDTCSPGVTGAALPLSSECHPFYEGTTGAASYLPCPCDQSGMDYARTGSTVSRDPKLMQGACNPITIQSSTSIPVLKKFGVPIDISTGAAAPVIQAFDDVPLSYWASTDINKLASSNVIAGYPDRMFRPNQTVTRAEFASMMVSGLDLNNAKVMGNQIFRDVPMDNWAKRSIDKVYVNGLMAGYKGDIFKPHNIISRAEALTTLAKSIPCELSAGDVDKILCQYSDGSSVPGWAKLSVAKALKSNVLATFPNPNMISPEQETTRADAAAMLSQLRISLGLQKQEVAVTCPTGAAIQMKEETINIPTLKVKFQDNITARASHTGDRIVAKTTDCITINGISYPAGSRVSGKIVEVVRPDSKTCGGLKIAFTDITTGSCKATLPREILRAQVQTDKKQNAISRLVQWPFVWTGSVLGNAGRTVGSAVVITGNAVEQVTNGVGIATGEVFQGKFAGAGRSIVDSTVALLRAPVDVTRTAISGTAGALQVTGDEIAYLVNPDGKRIAEIHPNETVSVAFGCQ